MLGVSKHSDSSLVTKNHVIKSIVKKETNSFSDVVSVVMSLTRQYGTDKVVIVMDIDNTILTSTTDLGSEC